MKPWLSQVTSGFGEGVEKEVICLVSLKWNGTVRLLRAAFYRAISNGKYQEKFQPSINWHKRAQFRDQMINTPFSDGFTAENGNMSLSIEDKREKGRVSDNKAKGSILLFSPARQWGRITTQRS